MASFGVRGRKRAKPFIVFVDDPTDVQRTQLLDRLRLDVSAASEGGELDLYECVDLFREVAQRCGSLSHALLPIRSTENDEQSDSVARLRELVHRGVLASFDSLVDAIHAEHQSQTTALVDALTPITGSKTQSRVVVATSFTESAIALSAEMIRRWGRGRVATHLKTNGEDDNRDAIARWTKGGSCSILVVDASAEEGANLQIADTLIHLDLPWESFRIEQRIGRCDRHAPTSLGPIESTVVAFGDEPYAMGWLSSPPTDARPSRGRCRHCSTSWRTPNVRCRPGCFATGPMRSEMQSPNNRKSLQPNRSGSLPMTPSTRWRSRLLFLRANPSTTGLSKAIRIRPSPAG